MNAISIDLRLQAILKEAEKLQSFVIDEVALTKLLEDAWKPIGKKLIRQLSSVIDFERGTYTRDKGFDIDMWLPEDLYDETAAKAWKKISSAAKKHLSKAYQRGWDEEGRNPFELPESAKKSVSSVFQERKAAAIEILLGIVEQAFTGYARETAIPAVYGTIEGLGKIDLLSKALAAQQADFTERDAAEIGRFEMLRKMRIAAQDKARADLIAALKGRIGEFQAASSTANLTISRAHHFGFLDWAEEEGIEYYEVSALLDSKTCPNCRAMDGKVFSLRDALAHKAKFLSIAGDKAKLKEEMPFLTKKNLDTAYGEVDISAIRKAEQNFFFPPFHPNCRCTVIAIRDIQAYAQAGGRVVSDTPTPLLSGGAAALDLSLIEPPPPYTGFNSIEDAEGYYSAAAPWLEIDFDSFRELDEEVALGTLNQFERLRLDYLADSRDLRILRVTKDIPDGCERSLGWRLNDDTLELNFNYFNDTAKIKEKAGESLGIGYASTQTLPTYEHVIIHEIGHFVYDLLDFRDQYELMLLYKDNHGSDISIYAEISLDEMFAEAFTAIIANENKYETTRAILDIIGKYAKVTKMVCEIKKFLKNRLGI